MDLITLHHGQKVQLFPSAMLAQCAADATGTRWIESSSCNSTFVRLASLRFDRAGEGGFPKTSNGRPVRGSSVLRHRRFTRVERLRQHVIVTEIKDLGPEIFVRQSRYHDRQRRALNAGHRYQQIFPVPVGQFTVAQNHWHRSLAENLPRKKGSRRTALHPRGNSPMQQ